MQLMRLLEIIWLLDGMIWIRGSSDDYDKWAEVTGDQAWSWKEILPYLEKVREIRHDITWID